MIFMRLIFSYIPLLTLITFFPFLTSQGQQQLKVLAEFGNEKITDEEFTKRFELMPHLSERQFNPDSAKMDFLYSLIAEKLWALEAEEKGYAASEAVIYSLKYLEKMYVRDALFQEEIESKIKLTDRDISREKYKLNTELQINIISSIDSAEIFSVYDQLKNNADFDSILMTRKEYAGQEKPVVVSSGDMIEEYVEDIIYGLNPGEISSPVRTESGWFIFKMKSKITNNSPQMEDPHTSVERRLKEKKSKAIGQKFLADMLTDVTIQIDPPLFYKLSEKILNILAAKGIDESTDSTAYLLESDITGMMNELGDDTLNMTLIRFEKDPINVREFLYFLIYEGFKIKDPEIKPVQLKLNNNLKYFTELELITREGYSRGYHKNETIKNELKLWRENYSAQAFRNSFVDSVSITDEEAYNYYANVLNTGAHVAQVNIIEILNEDLHIIEQVLNELNNGKDFKELAPIYTQREMTKDKGGVFGYFPVTMYGEIGRIAETLKPGEMYGPLKLPEGYSLFKLLHKRETDTVFTKPFEEVKEQIKSDLLSKKLTGSYNDYTAKLAIKYNLNINPENVLSLRLTEVPLFTYRYMGFGGRITAVPFTTPWYHWIENWRREKSKSL
jgi:parvulin-like peptidyl-prolyl isomerase